jgi:hypothetical protein
MSAYLGRPEASGARLKRASPKLAHRVISLRCGTWSQSGHSGHRSSLTDQARWGHVQLFSPWEYNIDRAAARLLAPTGWNSPDPDQYPTGAELVERYLEPLATRTALASHVQTNSRVTDISRAGFDKLKTRGREAAPFEIRYQNGQGPKVMRADAVIDASGTWPLA